MKKMYLTCVFMAVAASGCIRADQPSDPVVTVMEPAKKVEAPAEGDNGYLLPEKNGPMQFGQKPSGEAKGFSVWRSLGATLFVLGALVALNLYVRKAKFGKLGKSAARIKLLERYAIDQKKSLMLVEVDGRKVLLGVGGDAVSKVMSFDEVDVGFGEELEGQLVEEGK